MTTVSSGFQARLPALGRRVLPLVVILAFQLIVFPVPLGIWCKGAIVGGLTALVALGMALTWRSNGVVSFAQGDLGLAPVVLVSLLIGTSGWSWWVAVPVGLVVAALLGAAVERFVIRRFRRAPRLLLTVATIGLAQLLAGVAIALPRLWDVVLLQPTIDPPFSLEFTIGNVVFHASEVLALIAVPVAVGVLYLVLQRSQVGLAARAAADSDDRASLMGIPVGRIQTSVWSFAAVLSFVAILLRAGVLGLPLGAALSLGVLLRALTALLVGRMTDLPVIAATSVLLGVLELSVAFNASNPVIIDPILAGVVAVTLLLRGSAEPRGVRTAATEASAWRAADEVRPLPDRLAKIPVVRVVRTGAVALLIAIGIALPYLLPVDRSLKSSAVLLYAVLGCSVVVLTGWAGQVSLGQVGLFAIGAAVGAKATSDWGLDLLLALPIAGFAAAAAAVVIGFPALRLKGFELAVITLAASIAITSWLLNPRFFAWVPTERIERPPLLGRFSIDSPTAIHHLCLALLLVVMFGLKGIRSSRTGRALLALRDNERGGQAYGLSPLRIRLTAFALSGFVAGLAGCLFAQHEQAFGTQPYAPDQNIVVFTMVILGGVGSVAGALIGAVWLQGIRWFLPGAWQLLATGVGVLFVLLLLPTGIGGLLVRTRDRWLARVATRHKMVVPGFTAEAPAATGPAAVAAVTASVPDEEPALLRASGIEVGYDGVQVLFGVDLDIRQGEILALLGTNGAGKSTLLRSLCGITDLSGGTISFDGVDLRTRAAHEIAANGMRLMIGGGGIFASLTVDENLRAAAWLQRHDHADQHDRVAHALDPFPALQHRRNEPAGNLSGGQQQQLALAMALLARPRLLMVDELSLGLAPLIVGQLIPILRAARDAGTTILLVEQSAEIALAIADRAVFLEKGEVRFAGPAAELRDHPDLLRAVFLPGGRTDVVVASAADGTIAAAGDAVISAEEAVVEAATGSDALEVRLRTDELTVDFGGNRAVDAVTLEVLGGEIVGIIGPNGAGKTTLFDLLSGYLRADAGRVRLGTVDVTSSTPDERARAGLGRSFQDSRLFPSLTVEEAIAVACERFIESRDLVSAAFRLPWAFDSEAHVRRRVADLIELLELGDHGSKLVRELSTGTRRVVDLACLLAHRPTVILLDEPSSGIAQRESEALAPLLRRIRDETGASLVVVEHDIPLVRAASDRMVAMDQGGIIANGRPDDVLAHPTVVESYLGLDRTTIERSTPSLTD